METERSWWYENIICIGSGRDTKATKANAILKLKELWNCDKIVSFGDAVNDIPMFQIFDECYAVENAIGELKDMADGIIGNNDQDGVAVWLKENVKFDAAAV
ncbi:MAG: HAD hydrolase family protein [Dorea sp.]|nr:HAD hydrolase family protein [Dorea sp.]